VAHEIRYEFGTIVAVEEPPIVPLIWNSAVIVCTPGTNHSIINPMS
jgi:hypothetical protein